MYHATADWSTHTFVDAFHSLLRAHVQLTFPLRVTGASILLIRLSITTYHHHHIN